MWNNLIVSEELACGRENTGTTRGTTTSESRAMFYIKHKILEGEVLANQSVIPQSFTLPTFSILCSYITWSR